MGLKCEEISVCENKLSQPAVGNRPFFARMSQYEDGTTDVTRTMHFGEPTAEQKEVCIERSTGVISSVSRIFLISHKRLRPDEPERPPFRMDCCYSSETHACAVLRIVFGSGEGGE